MCWFKQFLLLLDASFCTCNLLHTRQSNRTNNWAKLIVRANVKGDRTNCVPVEDDLPKAQELLKMLIQFVSETPCHVPKDSDTTLRAGMYRAVIPRNDSCWSEICTLMKLNPTEVTEIKVAYYTAGGKFDAHYDEPVDGSTHTVLVSFLNTGFKGGETVCAMQTGVPLSAANTICFVPNSGKKITFLQSTAEGNDDGHNHQGCKVSRET